MFVFDFDFAGKSNQTKSGLKNGDCRGKRNNLRNEYNVFKTKR